jgi:hypothetical protein
MNLSCCCCCVFHQRLCHLPEQCGIKIRLKLHEILAALNSRNSKYLSIPPRFIQMARANKGCSIKSARVGRDISASACFEWCALLCAERVAAIVFGSYPHRSPWNNAGRRRTMALMQKEELNDHQIITRERDCCRRKCLQAKLGASWTRERLAFSADAQFRGNFWIYTWIFNAHPLFLEHLIFPRAERISTLRKKVRKRRVLNKMTSDFCTSVYNIRNSINFEDQGRKLIYIVEPPEH